MIKMPSENLGTFTGDKGVSLGLEQGAVCIAAFACARIASCLFI